MLLTPIGEIYKIIINAKIFTMKKILKKLITIKKTLRILYTANSSTNQNLKAQSAPIKGAPGNYIDY